MAKIERRKRRGCLLTLLLVLLLAIVVWLILIPIANNRTARALDKVVQENLSLADYPLEYGEVTVHLMKGQVGVSHLAMPVEDGIVTAEMLQVKVSLGQLIAFVLQKGPSLITPAVHVVNLEYDDKELNLGTATAVVTLEIFLDRSLPEEAVVRKLDLDARDVRVVVSEGASIVCQDIQLALKGNMTLATLEKDVDGVLDDLGYIDVKAIDGTILPAAETMAQLGMFALVSPWIADTNNWRFESLMVEARALEQAIVVDSLALHAPLMEASGTASLPRKGFQAVSMQLDVATLHNQVRTELAPIAQFMGQTIPSGAFGLSFIWDGLTLPELSFY